MSKSCFAEVDRHPQKKGTRSIADSMLGNRSVQCSCITFLFFFFSYTSLLILSSLPLKHTISSYLMREATERRVKNGSSGLVGLCLCFQHDKKAVTLSLCHFPTLPASYQHCLSWLGLQTRRIL